ncbi:hypothetical protein C8R43DRAFT_1118058 [Mycena crocata]|nr:hypothetical protein C8R43DRAFT_1118058 [Mycena crocata]
MSPPRKWQDSEYWIESRTHTNQFYYRHLHVGYFDGSPANPTWVPQQGIPLGTPPPPYIEGAPLGPPNDEGGDSVPPLIAVSSSGPSQQPSRQEDMSSGLRGFDSPTNTRFNIAGSSRSSGSRSYAAGSSRTDDRNDIGERSRSNNRSDIRNTYSHQVDRFREQRRQQSQDARERDRWDRHEQTRSVPDLRARMYGPTPDVASAVTFNGHPQFSRPPPPFSGEFPEYIPAPDPEYVAIERERRGRAIYCQSHNCTAPHPIRPTESNLVGPWHAMRIRTLSEAVNFELWLLAGCRYAREYYSWILRSYSGDPTTWQSEGESYILRRQDHILRGLHDRNEWLAEEQLCLAPVPEAPNTTSEAPTMLVDTPAPAPQESSSSAPTLQPRALNDLRMALDDIDQQPAELEGQNYLGTSPASPEPIEPADPNDPPTEENTSIRTSTRLTLADAIRFYANCPASGWPRGMRTVSGDIPTSDAASPHPGDVMAYNTIMALAPNRRATFLQHGEFVRISHEIFSIPGYYYRMAQIGGYVGDNEAMSQYPFDADHMNHAQVAVWYITHGIGIDSSIELFNLGSFARSARNVSENRANLTGIHFTSGFPQNNNDVLRLSADNVPAWEGLSLGNVREDARLDNPGAEILPDTPHGVQSEDETYHSSYLEEPINNIDQDSSMEDAASDATLLDSVRPFVANTSDRDPTDDLLDFE